MLSLYVNEHGDPSVNTLGKGNTPTILFPPSHV